MNTLWTALSKKDLLMELFMAEQTLDPETEKYWNHYKISPEIWKCMDVIEDNFWVIAKTPSHVIWYNDIAEGFNISRYKKAGEILEYNISTKDLTFIIQQLIAIQTV